MKILSTILLFVVVLICLLLFVFMYSKTEPLVKQVVIQPKIIKVLKNKIVIDYGKVWFANIEITPNAANINQKLVIRLKESKNLLPLSRYGSEPIGVRVYETTVSTDGHTKILNLSKADGRMVPKEIGVVMPFRYLELIGWKGKFNKDAVIMKAVVANAFSKNGYVHFFGGVDANKLNAIWELSTHTIAATSFAGIFVDGDRERQPYEADAYINQLGWLAVVGETTIPRRTFDYLVYHPNWPTEWQSQMIFMAWSDYMYTGDKKFLRKYYQRLKFLSLVDLISADGLISTQNISDKFKKQSRLAYPMKDIVDWPPNQRDGHEMVTENSVTNAFAYEALKRMAEIAKVLNNDSDEKYFNDLANKIRQAFHSLILLPNGLFSDGVGSHHTSAHSLFFPLVFNLVDEGQKKHFIVELKNKIKEYNGGFPGSVYSAQYLLEALFKSGEDKLAMDLLLNSSSRGWLHMLKKYNATITNEAWDIKYKPNEDWTHAWGSAPANVIPRFLLGIQPISPGWTTWKLSPSKAFACSAYASIPTPHGPIVINYNYLRHSINVVVPNGTRCDYINNYQHFQIGPGNHVLRWI